LIPGQLQVDVAGKPGRLATSPIKIVLEDPSEMSANVVLLLMPKIPLGSSVLSRAFSPMQNA